MNQELKDLKEEIKVLKNKNKEDIEKLNNEIIYLKNTNEKILKLFEEIQNKDKFRFCFRNGPNYTLSKNGKIAEKTNGGNHWNCSIIGDTPIPKYKLSKWKIRLNNFKIINNSINICLGIGPDNPNNEECFYKHCWSFSCGESKLMLKTGNRTEYNNHSGKLKEGDIVEVIVERDKGLLSFKVNDIDYGIACSDIPNDAQLYPIVNIYNINQIVEIID